LSKLLNSEDLNARMHKNKHLKFQRKENLREDSLKQEESKSKMPSKQLRMLRMKLKELLLKLRLSELELKMPDKELLSKPLSKKLSLSNKNSPLPKLLLMQSKKQKRKPSKMPKMPN